MSAGSRGVIAVSILILFLSGIPMTTEAGDAGSALVVPSRLAGSLWSVDSIRTTTESQASTPTTQPATQECDREAPPAGALTTFLHRILGRQRPTDIQLCAVPSDINTSAGAHK